MKNETPRLREYETWKDEKMWDKLEETDPTCSQGNHYDFTMIDLMSKSAFHANEPWYKHCLEQSQNQVNNGLIREKRLQEHIASHSEKINELETIIKEKIMDGYFIVDINGHLIVKRRERTITKLTECLKDSHDFLTKAPFDFQNGNVHGGMDEGDVLGNEYMGELINQIETTLQELKDGGE